MLKPPLIGTYNVFDLVITLGREVLEVVKKIDAAEFSLIFLNLDYFFNGLFNVKV